MILRAAAIALALCFFAAQSHAQLDSNPVHRAVQKRLSGGISTSQKADVSPVQFKRSAARSGLDAFIKQLFDEPDEQKQFESALLEIIQEIEKDLDESQLGTDSSVALAMSTTTLYTLATGKEVSETGLENVIRQFYVILSDPEIKQATDRQKQDHFEYALSCLALPLLIQAGSSTEEEMSKVSVLAGSLLNAMLGISITQLTISDQGMSIAAPKKPETTFTPAKALDGLAPGFTYSIPSGFKTEEGWLIGADVEKTQGGDKVNAAMFRFLPAVPATGNMGDVLRKLWKESVPAELTNNASGLVFRRFVGDGILCQFIYGYGREAGRDSDTLFTLYLVDCGDYWQPVVQAQTYADLGVIRGMDSFMAQYSFPRSAVLAESVLSSFRSTQYKKGSIADVNSLVGDFSFGSGASMDWVNIYTGATSTTFISYGGTLNLKADQTFTYTFTSASGAVGATAVRQAKGSGTWRVDGDILTTEFKSYDQGDGHKVARHQYRIASVTSFADGSKILILITDLNVPINPLTVTNQSGSYFTQKK